MHENDEIWDEFQWEEFLKQQDKKVDRFMELLYRYQDHPDRDEIIASEMGWTWLLEQYDEIDDNPDCDDDEVEEGEEWKIAAGIEDELFDFDSFESSEVYQQAHQSAIAAYRMAEKLPERFRCDSSVVDFVSNTAIAAAKVAGGTSPVDDPDELGCNIAYCKRGLASANLAIAALREMKEKNIVNGETYLRLMKEVTEVRNMIACYILELREKFYRST